MEKEGEPVSYYITVPLGNDKRKNYRDGEESAMVNVKFRSQHQYMIMQGCSFDSLMGIIDHCLPNDYYCADLPMSENGECDQDDIIHLDLTKTTYCKIGTNEKEYKDCSLDGFKVLNKVKEEEFRE
jgi:hypothetical protein